MTIYTAIYAMLAAMGLATPERRQPFLIAISLLFLLLFMGTRNYVGCDFTGYLHRYQIRSPNDGFFDAFRTLEPGFDLLEILAVSNGLSFAWLNFLATLVMIICLWVFLRRVRSGLLVLALLFPIILVQLGMSGVRQGIAVAFLMVAAVSFLNGNRWWTAIWILLGAQFHMSVVIFLPIAFLPGREVTLKQLFVASLVLLPFAFLVMGDRVDTYQTRYIENADINSTSGGATIRYAMNLVPALLFMAYRHRLGEWFSAEKQLLTVFAVATIATAVLIPISSTLLHRMNYYLMPFTILMVVYLVASIPGKRERMLALAAPVLAFLAYSLFWQYNSFHFGYCYADYQSYLLVE